MSAFASSALSLLQLSPLTSVLLLAALLCLPPAILSRYSAPARPHRVVVVGGSFAGLAVLRALRGARGLSVTLVEPRDHAEYVPGILRALVDARAAARLLVPLAAAAAGARVVRGRAVAVREGGAGGAAGTVVVAAPGGARAELAFDACVVATGSTYPAPVRAGVDGGGDEPASLAARAAALDAGRRALAAALGEGGRGVRVRGGGPVGVELAAELAAAHPRAAAAGRLELAAAAPRLLEGLHAALGEAAARWLRAAGVRVVLGAPRGGGGGGGGDGGPLEVAAFGARGAGDWVRGGGGAPALAAALDAATGRLRARPTLQLDGAGALADAVFVAGDVAAPRGAGAAQPALAHTAEKHAALVARNVRARARGRALRDYPPHGAAASPVIFAVSLGPRAALIEFAGRPALVGEGVAQGVAAVAKGVIEVTKVAAMAQRGWAVWFWWAADAGADVVGWVVGAPGGAGREHA